MNPYLLHRRKAFRQTGDPFWANVVFLQNFQGVNGSKPTTDQSQYAHALTWNGDAVISTAQSPFAGGSSLALDGSGDYILGPTSGAFATDLGTGDYTIDIWTRLSGAQTYVAILGTQSISGNTTPGMWRFSNRFNSLNQMYFNWTASNTFNDLQLTPNNYNDLQWRLFSLTREAGSLRFYVNGSLVSTSTMTANLTSGQRLSIGFNAQDITYITGNIGPLRITKGVARYTSNFTLPTVPFPTGP